MKRILTPLLCLLCLLCFPLNASAASEADVYAALRDIGVPEEYVGQAAGMLARGTSDGAGVYRSDGTYYSYSDMVAYIYANQALILSYCGIGDNGYTPGDKKTTTATVPAATTKTTTKQSDAAAGSTQTNSDRTDASADAQTTLNTSESSTATTSEETSGSTETTGTETETALNETTSETETTDSETTETTAAETDAEETSASSPSAETADDEKEQHGLLIAGGLLTLAAAAGIAVAVRRLMPRKGKEET